MNFDTVLLAAVTEELSRTIVGARVDKISQPEPLELVFSLYQSGSRRSLSISAEPESARIHLTRERSRPAPLTAPAYCMLLRKYIESGTITALSQPLGFAERVLRLSVASAERQSVHLWVELMGRQSNVVLTSENGMILGSLKRVTSEMSRLREVRTGIMYTPPPRQLGHKRDPMEPISAYGVPKEPFASTAEAETWLIATFRGVGSLLAKEAVLRAHEPIDGETAWYGLNDILSIVRLSEYAPVVCRNEHGHIATAYPFALRSVPAGLQTPVESISEAVEIAFSAQRRDDTLEKERTAILAALRRAAKSAERQLLDIREGLLNSDLSEYTRESGELLLASIGQIPAGSKEATVDDYFAAAPGAKRSIALDPTQTVQQNAERLFRRYQKARDSKDILTARQTEIELSENRITEAIMQADSAATVEELSEIAERIGSEIKSGQPNAEREAAARPAFEGHKIKMLKSPDGWEILVGENATSNDFLTTKVALPSDIWLHARAVPSAHAVIRSQNRPASVSSAAILLAAVQVARRSQAKHAGLVSVDYTLKKYVRKPRGSAPGQVTYTNEKTVDVAAGD